MRILLTSPAYQDSFAENVGVTLEAMGHQVAFVTKADHDAYYSFGRQVLRALEERMLGDRPSSEERSVLRVARRWRPDLVLSLTRGLHPEVLDEIGKSGARRALWWGDPPANNKRWGLLDPGWDAVFIKDSAAAAKLRLAGRNAHLLHEAMNPLWHKPVARQASSSVAVAGNSYAFRQAICLRLMTSGVPVVLYGSKPPVWSDRKYRDAYTGKYIVKEEKSRVFGEALACLNTFSLAEGNSLNCRAFEIAGAGGLQLIEYRPAIDECFNPGKELLAFSGFDELVSHIERARREPRAMLAIREAAARRALAEHTYRHRLDRLLTVMAGV